MGTTFEAEQLDPQVSFTIEKMKVGELSNPVPMKTDDQKDAYRLLYLKEKTKPHRANMQDDYAKVQEWALQDKQMKTIDKWMNDKAKETYVRIIEAYRSCEFDNNWLSK
jgi:peptidyl-prolyl cis-trans isomerase SurA